jgi:hypothetical protein
MEHCFLEDGLYRPELGVVTFCKIFTLYFSVNVGHRKLIIFSGAFCFPLSEQFRLTVISVGQMYQGIKFSSQLNIISLK